MDGTTRSDSHRTLDAHALPSRINLALWLCDRQPINSEDISDVTSNVTQYLWLAKSDLNKRND